MVRKVKDEVARWMLLIKECSNGVEVVLMEGVIMGIGHGYVGVSACERERDRERERSKA